MFKDHIQLLLLIAIFFWIQFFMSKIETTFRSRRFINQIAYNWYSFILFDSTEKSSGLFLLFYWFQKCGWGSWFHYCVDIYLLGFLFFPKIYYEHPHFKLTCKKSREKQKHWIYKFIICYSKAFNFFLFKIKILN